MPGSSPTFNMNGELVLINNSGLNIENFGIDEITLSSSGKEYYRFAPDYEPDKTLLQPGDSTVIKFSADPPLKIKDDSQIRESFDILFVVFADKMKSDFLLENHLPEKAY